MARVSLDPTHEGLALEGLTIHLRECGPDDPSANNNVVDGDLTGGDNRGGRYSEALRRIESVASALRRRINRPLETVTND
ncbi:MAG: hypothetical protein JSU68_13800 [Phycisphaerales bacterium]|nr:MAG: hypothetical protein JSU68_13800 [Phycisphaerales bacterium]